MALQERRAGGGIRRHREVGEDGRFVTGQVVMQILVEVK
jgi:hypothetical protein